MDKRQTVRQDKNKMPLIYRCKGILSYVLWRLVNSAPSTKSLILYLTDPFDEWFIVFPVVREEILSAAGVEVYHTILGQQSCTDKTAVQALQTESQHQSLRVLQWVDFFANIFDIFFRHLRRSLFGFWSTCRKNFKQGVFVEHWYPQAATNSKMTWE